MYLLTNAQNQTALDANRPLFGKAKSRPTRRIGPLIRVGYASRLGWCEQPYRTMSPVEMSIDSLDSLAQHLALPLAVRGSQSPPSRRRPHPHKRHPPSPQRPAAPPLPARTGYCRPPLCRRPGRLCSPPSRLASLSRGRLSNSRSELTCPAFARGWFRLSVGNL